MVFTFFITIVFIAELIIAITIFLALKRWSKNLHNLNLTLNYLKPSIKEISILVKKISGQFVEFSENFADKIKEKREEFIISQIAKIVIGTLLVKKFKKSKALKLIGKGLSLLQIVV